MMYTAQEVLGLPFNVLAALQLRESKMAARRTAARKHRYKRSTMSLQYHCRVQKKWTKRWGYVTVPCAYFIDLDAAGLGTGQALVCHPYLIAKIREVTHGA